MTTTQTTIPTSQHAVQLVGPGQLKVNPDKPVMQPGPRQILLKIEAVGLCFSDLKLLKQFSAHPRKAGIVSGIAPATLAEIPSYVPGETPVFVSTTVPVTGSIVGFGVRVSVLPATQYE